MQRLLRPLLIAVAATVLAIAAPSARAQSFSDTQRGEIERVVKDYLVAHPEVLQEVLSELEKRQSDADAAKHRDGVKQYSQALFYSPRQVTSWPTPSMSSMARTSTCSAPASRKPTAIRRWPTWNSCAARRASASSLRSSSGNQTTKARSSTGFRRRLATRRWGS